MNEVWPIEEAWDLRATNGGPLDLRNSFDNGKGYTLDRPTFTARIEPWSMRSRPLTLGELNTFETWFDNNIARGTIPFILRHPVTKAVNLWTFMGAQRQPYTVNPVSPELFVLQLMLRNVPGTPWWVPYVLANTLRQPYVVADYLNGVYGVDGVKTTASEVDLVSGVFDVYTTATPSGGVTVELNHTVNAGDIPDTQPPGVGRIVAYNPL